jgi:hypothetical protein
LKTLEIFMDPQATAIAGAVIAIGTLEMLYEKKLISREDGRLALDKALRRISPFLREMGDVGPEVTALIMGIQRETFGGR